MNKLIAHMSISLDGYIAGPHPTPDNPLGDHGLKLHDWIFKNPNKEHETMESLERDTGAIIMGRIMYDESLPWWHGSGPLGDGVPCFVLTEKGSEPEAAANVFTFVTDGIERALELANTAAGAKNIFINGGANTIQQYIKAGLLDELTLHIVPILLGGGTSLFGSLGAYLELEKIAVQDEEHVTHITYRFKRA